MNNKRIMIPTVKIGLLINLVWIIIGCNQDSQKETNSDFFVDSIHTVISDTSQLKWITKDLVSFWTPNTVDLRLTESILKKAIKENLNEYWSLLDTLTVKKYYRQYVFYIDSQNDSIVHINAFCEVLERPVDSAGTWIIRPYDWKNYLIIMRDGGDCYWSIKINLTKNTYFNFMVNGEA